MGLYSLDYCFPYYVLDHSENIRESRISRVHLSTYIPLNDRLPLESLVCPEATPLHIVIETDCNWVDRKKTLIYLRKVESALGKLFLYHKLFLETTQVSKVISQIETHLSLVYTAYAAASIKNTISRFLDGVHGTRARSRVLRFHSLTHGGLL